MASPGWCQSDVVRRDGMGHAAPWPHDHRCGRIASRLSCPFDVGDVGDVGDVDDVGLQREVTA